MRRLGLLLAVTGCVTTGAHAQRICRPAGDPLPVPGATALAAGGGPALRLLADRLVAIGGGDVWLAQFQLQHAAGETEDPAARFLLLEEAIAVAERAGQPAAAFAAIGELAHNFVVDERARSLAMLARLQDGSETARVGGALSALARAEATMLAPDDGDMLRYHDAALRCALHADDVPVYEYVRDRIAWLRGWRDAASVLAGAHATAAQHDAAAELLWPLVQPGAQPPFPAGDLARVLPGLMPDEATAPLDRLPMERLRALAGGARSPVVAAALRQRAMLELAADWNALDDAQRTRNCRAMIELATARSATPGVHVLRFRSPADREQLVRANGVWQVADGRLLGRADGANNFATHRRLRFGAIRALVVRGGIRSADGLNFRVHVGDLSLLLNWEVRPENHLWHGGQCLPKGPPALVPGKEHEIAFLAGENVVHVCIDGVCWWSVPAALHGTVTVYPALGSEIFVREILVDGEPVDAAKGPAGNPM